MPRIRTLKPEHRQHRKVGRLTDQHYRLWVGLILEADDAGRLIADPGQLRLAIFGYQDKTTEAMVRAGLTRLANLGLIILYAHEGLTYAAFPSWLDHQRINRPTASFLPSPEDSLSTHGAFTEDSLSTHGGSEGRERKGSEGSVGSVHEHAVIGLGADAPAPAARTNLPIPDDIEGALNRCTVLGQARGLRNAFWWRAEIRANNGKGIDYPGELLRAEAWMATNPARAPKKNFQRFMHSWFARSEGTNGNVG